MWNREGLHSRRRFWIGAVGKGWREVVGLKDHLEVALVLFVGALIVGGVSFRFGGQWYALSFALAILAAIILDGAYLEWKELENRARTHPEKEVLSIRVVPTMERGFRYLSVENLGQTAEFQAQVEIVGGNADWLDQTPWRPSMPYTAFWDLDGDGTNIVRLFQGQKARLAIVGIRLPEGGPKHAVAEFPYYSQSPSAAGHYERFFSRRIEGGIDEIEKLPPLIFEVKIGASPSMGSPFVGRYRYRTNVPLEETT
jgi:hypothetical protein